MTAPPLALDDAQVENHPLVDDVNALHNERLSPVERSCRKIAEATGAPVALMLAIVLQLIWIGAGVVTKFDPFPFVFLLTCSNVLQLILIFVLAVGQRQQVLHDEIRAESDHDSISRLLYHQQLQEKLLLRLCERSSIEVSDLKTEFHTLIGAAAA